MTRALLTLLCCGSIVAPRVAAPAPTDGAALVVLKGVETPEEATEVLQRWSQVGALLRNVLQPSAGYPKVVTQRDYPEIEPGRHLVILGVCPLPLADAIVKQIRMPMLSGRTFEVRARGPRSCPTQANGWSFGAGGWVLAKLGDQGLAGGRYDRTAPQTGTQQSMLLLYLRDELMKLASTEELVFPAGCTASVTEDADAIRIEKTCTTPGEPPKEVLRYTAANGKIVRAPDASAMKDLRALVWISGKTEAAAREAIPRWEREKAALADLVTLAPGYPRVVRAEDHAGLAPGAHHVLLGLCPGKRLEQEGGWEVLQAFDPNLKLVPVQVRAGEPACPVASPKAQLAWRKHVRSGAHDLTAATFGDAGTWDLRVFLRGPGGALLEWKREDALTAEQHKDGGQCRSVPQAFDSTDEIEVSFSCLDLGPDDLLDPRRAWTQEFTYSVHAGKLSVKMRVDPPKPRSR
jgi:hypothetical protein